MKIICVVKFVPDGDSFDIEDDKPVPLLKARRLRINPDDECAIGLALKIKKSQPDTSIELLTMGPPSLGPLVEDILRVGVDRATIISDEIYASSDAWVTSKILARYLTTAEYDGLFTGSHAIDGGSSSVPPLIGAALGLVQLSGITKLDEDSVGDACVRVDVEDEASVTRYEIDMPAVLSFSRKSGYRLPYVRFKNRNRDVTDKLVWLSNNDLGFDAAEVGLKGARTKIARSFSSTSQKPERRVVGNDQQGVDAVYNLLKEKRFI
ncbi:electron transfer flavoprotein subunit beta/FixA family protein [Cohaesibacter celericrescens]|uniref:Electron transfer flavoprotein subunit beta/FixA family protein n=1 Tax=Cohaesibacter celericrescens TaxID=2067669 RepID=A0A2N5XUY4_9HYPH|nr:electron transfer flavoprotein subunit beta/FixA family protein [Cohaesibacter celericrescens]PLW78299.1 electron transfer flavoprotein subunit beta/FixA family protein [Cohaesibacter celericrescens]